MRKPIKVLIGVLVVMLFAIGSVGTIAMAAVNNSESANTESAEKESKRKNAYSFKKRNVSVDVTEITASVLSITKDEVKEAIKAGKIGDLLISAGKVDEFKIAYLAELKSKLDAAVTDETLTQEQADEKYASAKEKMNAYDGTTHLFGSRDHASKKEFEKGFSKDFKKDRKKDGANVNVTSIAASVLGKTEDEVKSAIKDGKVGDLLIAEGKVDAFKTAYLAELKSKLDAAVADGTLTQEQADEKYASEKEKMDAYDGTTHLCGGKNHGKIFDKKSKTPRQ